MNSYSNQLIEPRRRTVYDELAAVLSESIRSGRLQAGDRLPTEPELSKRFGISISSVRRGVDQLVDAGLIERRQGSGSYVCGAPRIDQRPAGPPAADSRETVAVILPVAIRGYHPFFSEVLNGIRHELTAAGMVTWDFDFAHRPAPTGDLQALPLDTAQTARQLRAEANLAGAVIGATAARELAGQLPADLPVVTADPSDSHPYVAYDWAAELQRAVRQLAADGAHKIWALGPPTADPPGLDASVTIVQRPASALLSEVIHEAYDLALQALESDPEIDGLAVGSDFEAQGVMDALVRADRRVPEDIRVCCLTNRTSQLTFPFPVTTLVADGFRKGRELVRLLRRRMTAPRTAPSRVLLACDLEDYQPVG